MVLKRNLQRTTIIMVGLMLVLIGLIASRNLTAQLIYIYTSSCFIICLIVLKKFKYRLGAALFLTICLVLGLLRGHDFAKKTLVFNDLYGKQVVLEVVAREDSVYSDKKQLMFSASQIFMQAPSQAKLVGNIEIEGIGVPMVYKGDKLVVSGKLYKKRGDNIAGISFANISVVYSKPNIVDKFRRQFASGLMNVLPEPLASLGLGILIGQRSTLPDELNKQLTRVGLIHIVAVSGYNLTIIIYAALRFFQKRSRFQALVVASSLIIIFLLVTGFSPSITRAAVVCILGLLFWFYGRTAKPMMILLISAAITAGINPLFIWSSVGWYLSFSAFFGILVLGPSLHKKFVPKKQQNNLLIKIFTETLAAQVCTLPVILYVFSTISLVSVVANLLVVPIIPFVMLATLISGLGGMLLPLFISSILALPARIMLSYIVEVTYALGATPFASKDIHINLAQALLMGCLIVVLTLLLRVSSKRKLISDRIDVIT